MNKENELVSGQIEFLNNGNAYVKLEDQKEIFIHKKNTSIALHKDIVSISLFKRENRIEGKVESVVARFKNDWVGTVSKNGEITFVVPDTPKCHVDFLIPKELTMGAKNNQKVTFKLKKWKNGSKSPYGEITKILGEVGDNNAEMNSIMYEYLLPIEFPKKVEEESLLIDFSIPSEEISKRRDMRNALTFTIDPVDAKDFDDALSVEFTDDYIEVGIHIADVTHYITPGSELDKEAFNRATSVYLVDRCIPMLPHRLSNGVCSLRPREDKLCYSVVLKMNTKGEILDRWFGRTVIHSDRRFTYEEAQAIIDNVDNDVPDDLKTAVLCLDKLAKQIRNRRANSIKMDGVEVRFNLDEKGKPLDVYFKIQKDSNRLIEEFMLLANKEVSKILSNDKFNSIYRVHDSPNEDKLDLLKGICNNFGYSLDISKDKVKESLNKLLQEISGKPEENMIETLITRSMSKAVYSTKNIGHYGLGFDFYTHFTSPIRRYSDCIAHRLLTQHLENARKFDSSMEEACLHINGREITAAKAQRDSIKYKQAEYLQDKIGRQFVGIISGVTEWGIYVELTDNKCEGMIRLNNISKYENYDVDVNNHIVIGKSTGKVLRLGDEVNVYVKSVSLEKKTIDFEML